MASSIRVRAIANGELPATCAHIARDVAVGVAAVAAGAALRRADPHASLVEQARR